MGERKLELWLQEPTCPNAPLVSHCKVKRWQGPTPKQPKVLTTFPFLYQLQAKTRQNGFPGSRPQHEATTDSPEVTLCVKFPGLCYANIHEQPLL